MAFANTGSCLLFLLVIVISVQSQGNTRYVTPKPSGPVVFLQTFNDDQWTATWKPSEDPDCSGDWSVQESEYVNTTGDRGLVVSTAARHHAIAALFPTPLDTTGKDLVIQYEVQLQHGLDCGGAYMKIVTDTPSLDIKKVNSRTPYTIMFGPDKCGMEDKLHFIIRHENPLDHTIEEKHISPRPHIKVDKLTHLYTLYIRNDNTFEISIDREVVKSGNLLTDLQPPINPPKEIDDINDEKPSDWVDDEEIPDMDATKPDDWDESEPKVISDPNDKKPEDWLEDEPLLIPDPNAKKPSDWDDEEDGEWVVPTIDNPKCEEQGCGEWKPRLIKNPKYKGKWTRPLIKNPEFKGVWRPRQVPNPDYFEDLHPSNFPKMAGIAFELWTMTNGIMFDNILITHDKAVADDYAQHTWAEKYAKEKAKFDEEQARLEEAGKETWSQMMERYYGMLYEFATEYPILLGASVVVGLIPVFVCSAISSPPKKPSSLQQPGEETKQVSNEGKEEKKEEKEKEQEQEEETQAETEEIKKSPLRKRKVPLAE